MNGLQRFHHPAMNTTFGVLLPAHSHPPASLAREIFDLLDDVEDRLSLYREGSDVWRLNRLRAGESLVISEPCHRCLLLAMEVHAQTAGYFDVTVGRQIAALKHHGKAVPHKAPTGLLSIDPDRPVVHCIEEGRWIDLGGIGKGFALDLMAERLREFDLPVAFLSAGASTHLAFGETAMSCSVGPQENPITRTLRNGAISASGDAIQGPHIVSPSGNMTPTARRAWVHASTATAADAWSTAATIIPTDNFAQLAQTDPSLREAWILQHNSLRHWTKGH